MASTSSAADVESHDATMKIQAVIRGRKERKEVDDMIQEGLLLIEEQATHIRRIWRGKKHRMSWRNAHFELLAAKDPDELTDAEFDFMVEHEAALKLQRTWRGHRMRKAYADGDFGRQARVGNR
jgi:hypothetical protein